MNVIFGEYKIKYTNAKCQKTQTTNKYFHTLKKEIQKGNVIEFSETSDRYVYTILKKSGKKEFFYIDKVQACLTDTKKDILKSLLELNNTEKIQNKIISNQNHMNTNFGIFKRLFYERYNSESVTFKELRIMSKIISLLFFLVAVIVGFASVKNFILSDIVICFLPEIINSSISLITATKKYYQEKINAKYELPLSKYKKIKTTRKYTTKKAKELEVSIEKQIIDLASKLNKDIIALNNQELKKELLEELNLGLAGYQKDLMEILSHENKPGELLINGDKDFLSRQFLASLQLLEEKINNSYKKEEYPEELKKLQAEIEANLENTDSTLVRVRTI